VASTKQLAHPPLRTLKTIHVVKEEIQDFSSDDEHSSSEQDVYRRLDTGFSKYVKRFDEFLKNETKSSNAFGTP